MKALFNRVVAEVEVVVFDFKSLFEIGEGTSELFSAAEDARKVVIGHCAVAVALFSQHLSLAEEFQSDVEVLFIKETCGLLIRYLQFQAKPFGYRQRDLTYLFEGSSSIGCCKLWLPHCSIVAPIEKIKVSRSLLTDSAFSP